MTAATRPTLILSSSRRPKAKREPIEGPRTDFDALAGRLSGHLLYPEPELAPPVTRLESKLRISLGQAVRARRVDAAAYVSFSERVGMPLSLLRPQAPHVLIAHLLTSPQKRRAAAITRYLRRTDVTLVFARPQERYLRDEVGLDADRARFIWDKVDHRFFTASDPGCDGGYVLSVGREQRDYETLLEALRPLGLPAVIVAGSTWSHRSLSPMSLPDHVELREGLSYPALRDLYAGARLVVVPVFAGIDYAAGVNGVLEGMACARPVIASDTPGLSGYVRDGIDGRTVAAGEPEALSSVIDELWHDRAQAERLGRAARHTVESGRTVDHFVERVADLVESLA